MDISFFVSQKTVIHTLDVSFVVSLNNLLNKQSNCWWCSCDITIMIIFFSSITYPRAQLSLRTPTGQVCPFLSQIMVMWRTNGTIWWYQVDFILKSPNGVHNGIRCILPWNLITLPPLVSLHPRDAHYIHTGQFGTAITYHSQSFFFINEMEFSSFWWDFHHWLHWKLSYWQLPVQPVMKISSKWHFCFRDFEYIFVDIYIAASGWWCLQTYVLKFNLEMLPYIYIYMEAFPDWI